MLVQSLRKADSFGLNKQNRIIELLRNAYVNIVPHQSAQAIIQSGTRYVDSFTFFRRLNFRFGRWSFYGFRFVF